MRRLQLKRWSLAVTVGVLLSSLGAQLIHPDQKAEALAGSQFNAGRIIDDFVFKNNHTMSAVDIQNFLNSKVPNCDRNGTKASTHWNGSAGRYYTRAEWGALNGQPGPYVCLRDYVENPSTKANNLQGAPDPAGGRSAAQLMKDVSDAYSLNPQVLLVLLQKEQSLITDDWPWTTQYRSATGYGCPDTAPCNSQYYGFYNQISNAAWQFNQYAARPNSYGFKTGRSNYIGYNPNAGCGGSNVTITTQATTNLYIYTPYQPNAAALNNLYGSGDGCSAYGNRNFWRMFNDWFGGTYADDTFVAHPNGTLITDGNYVYLVEGNTKRHIVNATIFDSLGFSWPQVRRATTGDLNLHVGGQIAWLAPGLPINIGDGKLYITDYFNGELKLQWISFSTFNALGYTWGDVKNYTSGGIFNSIQPGLYEANRHPTGTVVVLNNAVHYVDQTSLHHLTPTAFSSWGFNWNRVKNATSGDAALAKGPPQEIREGTMILSGGIYVISKDGSGTYKQPLGPWECYQHRLHFGMGDLLHSEPALLPQRTGPLFTC